MPVLPGQERDRSPPGPPMPSSSPPRGSRSLSAIQDSSPAVPANLSRIVARRGGRTTGARTKSGRLKCCHHYAPSHNIGTSTKPPNFQTKHLRQTTDVCAQCVHRHRALTRPQLAAVAIGQPHNGPPAMASHANAFIQLCPAMSRFNPPNDAARLRRCTYSQHSPVGVCPGLYGRSVRRHLSVSGICPAIETDSHSHVSALSPFGWVWGLSPLSLLPLASAS